MAFLFIVAWVLVALAGVILIQELAHRSVYGPILTDKQIEKLLGQRLEKMHVNPYGNHIMSDHMGPYVAIANSLRSKWHIEGVGCISRRSRWSKKLDDRRIELLSKV